MARRESGWKVKKMNNRQENRKISVLASLHSFIICVMVLASFCFAWFTETVQIPGDTIQAAIYGITAEVSGNGTVSSGDFSSFHGEESQEYLTFEVENGQVYDIRLRAMEGSSAGNGYCIVSAGDDVQYDVYYTSPIGNGADTEVAFRILFRGTGSSKIAFIPYWGVYPNTIPAEGVVPIPLEKDILVDHGKYVVSDGDIMVSPGDSK